MISAIRKTEIFGGDLEIEVSELYHIVAGVIQ